MLFLAVVVVCVMTTAAFFCNLYHLLLQVWRRCAPEVSKMDLAWQKVDDALERIRREVDTQREKSNAMCQLRTAHNWVDYKAKVEYDDETMTFFWRAHTFTVLAFLICCLVYVGVIEAPPENVEDMWDYNSKRGAVAALFFWVALGMTIMPDGPFVRPHPAIWRFAFVVSIVYELLLIFLLFQTPDDARKLLKKVVHLKVFSV